MRASKDTRRRAFMNLRCAICCLNVEPPRDRHGPVSMLFMAVHLYARNLSFQLARALCVAFLFSPTLPRSAELCSLVSWILTPETPRKKGAQKEGMAGVQTGVRRRGEKEKRRLKYHGDIIRYRCVVYPYRHPPYGRIKQPSILISWWRQRDAMRPAESHAAEPSRRDSQDRALIEEHELGEKEGGERQGGKQDAFFGRARARRHYSHEDRKHRGARREGWDPWIIARSYFFFLYIVLYLGGEVCAHTHTKSRAGCYARPDTALTRAGKNREVRRSVLQIHPSSSDL